MIAAGRVRSDDPPECIGAVGSVPANCRIVGLPEGAATKINPWRWGTKEDAACVSDIIAAVMAPLNSGIIRSTVC